MSPMPACTRTASLKTMKTLFVFGVWLVCCSVSAFAQTTLKVGVSKETKPYEPLIAAIYQEIGLVAEFVVLPAERSLRSVDSGAVDADIGRVVGAARAYPNAMETHESVLDLQLLAVVRSDFAATTLSVADLRKYRIGYLHGFKMAEGVVQSLGMTASQTNSMESLLQMLLRERFDVALVTAVTPLSKYPEFADHLTTLAQPLLTTRVVHVMNKKWADYIPMFDAAVRRMKADGRIARLLPAR